MKKALSLLSLAALTIGLLGSCSKINERIDGLDHRIGNIENEKIASIENQIAAINASIADLGTIRQDILDLQVAVGAKGEDIAELKAADEALGKRIDKLQTYVDTELAKYATEDWANATFATLGQLDSTKKDLNALEGKVNNLGETFDGKLSDLKTELTNSINTAASNLETRISTLEARVSAIEQMIQSVSIIPAYSDGSVEALDGDLTLRCIVSPADALDGMLSLKDSLLLYADSVKVKTRAATSTYMKINVSQATVTDGVITLKAKINEYLPKGAGRALTVALNIKNGISNFTTEFVTVTDIPFVDLGVTNAAGKSLYWAKCNLGADNPQDPGDYYMWGATALMYSAVDYNKVDSAFTFVTVNPYGDNYINEWDASKGFDFNNVPFANGVFKNNDNERNVFTKYTTSAEYAKSGSADGFTTLKSDDDAATAKNASWRMPTIDDFKSLVANCVLVWTSDYNSTGNAGYIVYKAKDTDDNDKGKANMNGTWKKWNGSEYSIDSAATGTYSVSDIHIFLPAAGEGNNTKLEFRNVAGCYYSSDLNETNNQSVGAVNFNKSVFNIAYNNWRFYGFSIRPVTEE